MVDLKLTRPCTLDDAIRFLKIPDDAATYVQQLANFHPGFPRRYSFGQLNVVPLQLAHFLIELGVGYLLEDGPCAYLLEEDDLEVVEPDADDGDDDQDDDESGDGDDKDDEDDEPDDGRPPKRPRRRR